MNSTTNTVTAYLGVFASFAANALRGNLGKDDGARMYALIDRLVSRNQEAQDLKNRQNKHRSAVSAYSAKTAHVYGLAPVPCGIEKSQPVGDVAV